MRWACIVVIGAACRIGFAPADGSATVGDAGVDSPLPAFRDDFEDGDFTVLPAGAESLSCNPGSCGTMAADIVEDIDGRWLRLKRSSAPNDGGAVTVRYDLARAVADPLRLLYRTRVVLDEIGDGGGFCTEYPTRAYVTLILTDASTIVLRYMHNAGSSRCLVDATNRYTPVTANQWTTVEWDLAGHLVDLGRAPAVQLEKLELSASGWNFENHFDDVMLE